MAPTLVFSIIYYYNPSEMQSLYFMTCHIQPPYLIAMLSSVHGIMPAWQESLQTAEDAAVPPGMVWSTYNVTFYQISENTTDNVQKYRQEASSLNQ